MTRRVAGNRTWVLVLAALAAFLSVPQTSNAGGHGCPICAGYAPAPCGEVAYQLIQRTVYVPMLMKERRTVHVTEYHHEVRQRTVNVSRYVPETKAVREVYMAMVPEVHERVENYRVQKPVWREVEQQVVVQVPQVERRAGVRHVCRPVQTQEMRTIVRDQGQWEEVPCESPCFSAGYIDGCGRVARRLRGCGGCGGCGECAYDAGCGGAVVHTHRVWRPNLVTEQVPVTVWRYENTEEPFEYSVTVFKPEVQVRRVKVCDFVAEERQRTVKYTVCVPQRRERVRNITTYRVLCEPQVQNYTVRVPHVATREVDVTVCRMVPKQVQVRVPVCGPVGPVGCYH